MVGVAVRSSLTASVRAGEPPEGVLGFAGPRSGPQALAEIERLRRQLTNDAPLVESFTADDATPGIRVPAIAQYEHQLS